ncbi:alpha/beta hydrolase [Rhodococcus rhodnii]|uniref:Esterase n=2 Tax=Rhodococcus rhodnii TaxID=38312 RepID=R7WT99_9NOCA|nr:alpha/beta fold hydrolase [Rhodococcus rhodnii]EOM78506.1 esterase [Rhodococcus rhodnii LMG 5362]TXG91300.1 alpha/beta hydrolase [Rhodococcus rhodnii]
MTRQRHYVLVPGFWLGAWAWDDMLGLLTSSPAAVATALTLPGLEPTATAEERAAVTLDDHIDAVVNAVLAVPPGEETVLVAHSGGGPLAYAASDRVPTAISRIVYVDTGPIQDGATLRPDVDPDIGELPLPTWADLEADGNSLDGLDGERLATFAERAVPQPAGPARTPYRLTDPRRLTVPTTLVCTSFSAAQLPEWAAEGFGPAVEAGALQNVEYVDLPTGHWPMWSRSDDLAAVITT